MQPNLFTNFYFLETPPSSVDDYIKISSSLSIKPRENAPSLAQNRLGLKVSKILNDVVLEAKKHSQKTMMHGNDHLNLDNTGGNDEVVKSIAGMASSDRDASKEGTLGDKNFVKCVGDIEEAVKNRFYFIFFRPIQLICVGTVFFVDKESCFRRTQRHRTISAHRGRRLFHCGDESELTLTSKPSWRG